MKLRKDIKDKLAAYDNVLNFYARTKNGIRSLKSSGYVFDVEDDFEPVTEGDTV